LPAAGPDARPRLDPIHRGPGILPGVQRMQELFQPFLRTYQARLKPSTYRDYRSILGAHLARFKTFEDLNRGLEEYLAELQISGKRKNNILSCSRCFVAWARRREHWEGRFLRIPRFPHRSRKTKPLSPDEANLMMRYSPPPWKHFFQLSILTGLRTGEALGLRFEDFNLPGGYFSVKRSITAGQVSTTKTLSSEREIPILRPIRELYEMRRRGNRHGSPWFLYSPTGRGVMGLGTLRNYWKRSLKLFEIEVRPIYATRHTFASLAIAAGEDPLWVARIMGHARPDQLLLRYASYLEGVKPDGKKFLAMVMGKGTFLRAVT
jgi:integrase